MVASVLDGVWEGAIKDGKRVMKEGGPFYYANFAVQGLPGPNRNQQAEYRPTMINKRIPGAIGNSVGNASERLRTAAFDCALSKCIVLSARKTLQAMRPRVRLSNEAQQEIEAFAYSVDEAMSGARFTTSATVDNFIKNARGPAQQLLELIEADLEIAARVMAMGTMADFPDTYALSPSSEKNSLRSAVVTLRKLLGAPLPLRVSRGRRISAGKAETAALIIMHAWHHLFGEVPDFSVSSHFMCVALPALEFYGIRKADPATFLRETMAKAGKLVPVYSVT